MQSDKVYDKPDYDKRWKGPGTVIGQEGNVVFVRRGTYMSHSRFIRCGSEFGDESFESNSGVNNDIHHGGESRDTTTATMTDI